MRSKLIILPVFLILAFMLILCSKSPDLEQFKIFNQQFLAEKLPEISQPRLLTPNDLPESQRKYFKENHATLQTLLDLNGNGVPEYLICGASDSLLKIHEHRAYFFAIFEQTENGIERKFLQKLNAPPVNLRTNEREGNLPPSILLIFAFSSNFAAEIYYEDGQYRLERWY